MSETTPVVYIVDDDSSVRKALERLIRSVELEARSFASAREFLSCDRADAPGCLVLDVRMPEMGGLDLQKELTAKGIRIPIIFVTGHGDVPMSVRAMKAGAADFLEKPFNNQQLLDAIHAAVASDRLERIQRAERATIQNRVDTLTPREREVFALVVTGMPNKQVAHKLGTSEKTIKVHRARVMEKMQADSLVELVRLAGKAGISASVDRSSALSHEDR